MDENIRVSELAKELGLTSKEVLEKFAQLSINIKSHSNSVTPLQVQKLKDFIAAGSKLPSKKPKAFIVKKKKEVPPAEEPKKEENPENSEKPAVEVVPKIEKVERKQVEVVKKEPQSRLEIVKRVPIKRVEIVQQGKGKKPVQKVVETSPKNNINKQDNKSGFDSNNEQNSRKPKEGTDKPKRPIERHIISQDIYENKGFSKKKGSSDKKKDKDYSKKEEQERISLEKAAAQHHKKKTAKEEVVEEVKSIIVDRAMTISELADKIHKTPAEIVKFLMFQGVMATVNQLIDVDVIKKVCAEYELEVLEEDLEAYIAEEEKKEEIKKQFTEVDKKLLKKRAPVVSIMGHVDHGKTTLLDSIRASKHKIVSTEVGGITQSIGAYTVYLDNKKEKKIVFVDTPGHEAFTEMRARGAKATDIAILVVAADDGIMPQTIEAINHAKAAEVPIIVAVNKIDKAGADPDRVLTQLTEHNLIPEEWGGDTITVKVSALQGTGIDDLLEYIWILADIKDLRANPKAEASGVVIEANLDKGKGPVATLLVQNGTLRAGNCIVVGTACGRVRALLSDSGERIKSAEPSTPVEVLGLSEVPSPGEYFEVVKNEKEMKTIVAERQMKARETRLDAMLPAHIRKESGATGVGETEIPQLNLIIKADTYGSAEAVSQAIAQFESKEIITKIIHVGVGDISEADVMLASASNALILGFGVREDNNALIAAGKEHVTIKKYDIIYQILEDIEKTMISLLSPETKEIVVGTAEVRQVFTIGKVTKIAGCYVTDGKINRNNKAVVKRDGVEIFSGLIDQLKRFKDDVKEVAQGYECGISFVKFNDIVEGDIVEFITTQEIERTELE